MNDGQPCDYYNPVWRRSCRNADCGGTRVHATTLAANNRILGRYIDQNTIDFGNLVTNPEGWMRIDHTHWKCSGQFFLPSADGLEEVGPFPCRFMNSVLQLNCRNWNCRKLRGPGDMACSKWAYALADPLTPGPIGAYQNTYVVSYNCDPPRTLNPNYVPNPHHVPNLN